MHDARGNNSGERERTPQRRCTVLLNSTAPKFQKTPMHRRDSSTGQFRGLLPEN